MTMFPRTRGRDTRRLLPTTLGAKGAAFFVVVLVLFFATPYSNLFFLLTAFLATLGALGMVGAATNMRGVSAELAAVSMVSTGQPHELTILVRAPQRPRLGIEVQLELASGRLLEAAATTVVRDGEQLRGQIEPMPRGIHEIAALVLRSRHPFGVFRATLRLPVSDAALVAYPIPADATTRRTAGDPLVDGSASLAGGRDSVASLRPWQTGDALRDVHWKATARRSTPIVKELDRDVGDGIEVVLDRRAEPDALEQALSVLTAMLLAAGEAKQPLRLRSQSHAAVYSTADIPVREGLRWLAAAVSLPADGPPPAAGSPTAIQLPSHSTGATASTARSTSRA